MSTSEPGHKVGEYVVYKKNGIYQISGIKRDKICGVLRDYYVLKSVYDSNAAVYVPADCDALVASMEHVLSKDEIDDIIRRSCDTSIRWIPAAAERRVYLEELVEAKDLATLVAMYKILFEKKEEALRLKGKTFAHDERMLSIAKSRICEAFAFSLGIDKKDVMSYVCERIGIQTN